MMAFTMNPGTQVDNSATLSNAVEIASRLLEDTGADSIEHVDGNDADGWFRFHAKRGDRSVAVDIPGDDPNTVCEGRPFHARRLYVDGSSWLYGFAVSVVVDRLGLEDPSHV